MQRRAEADRSKKTVEVSGSSIEEALGQASIELGLPVKELDYEVVIQGNRGAFGIGKKDWVLNAYEATRIDEQVAYEGEVAMDFDLDFSDESKKLDEDGEAFVRLSSDGAFLKITPPKGKGKRTSERRAIEKLLARSVTEYNADLVSRAVKQADGGYVRVGEFTYNPVNDSVMNVDITEMEMKAVMVVSRPGAGGTDLTAAGMIEILKNSGVVYGIKEDVAQAFEDRPEYGQPVVVAEGTKPENGHDAEIVYNFETDRSNIKLKEKNGRVDFRELNLVQNVVEGQILARKIAAQEGTPGRTVTGKLIPAKAGRNFDIGVGKNVELSEDGMTLTAMINGQVILVADKINVEPLYVVEGDVNLKTGGNVIFLGTVLVKGSVEDGFKVKASGNIEVLGNIGKCELDAEGDIIVHQGINGKSGGRVRAGKGVWAKFIENAFVEAGEMVVASDGIINSEVDANNSIACHGKRATIVGGRLRAAELIVAKVFGSISGSETILEVGYDPKSKSRLADEEEAIRGTDKTLEEIDLNIHTLTNLKKAQGNKLPEEKEKYLVELTAQKTELLDEKKAHEKEIEEIRLHLSSLQIKGKISASARVYAGVKIFIKDANLEVRNEFKAVTFINESNLVKVTKYEEPEEDFERRK
jgi:hypothetical protein